MRSVLSDVGTYVHAWSSIYLILATCDWPIVMHVSVGLGSSLHVHVPKDIISSFR